MRPAATLFLCCAVPRAAAPAAERLPASPVAQERAKLD